MEPSIIMKGLTTILVIIHNGYIYETHVDDFISGLVNIDFLDKVIINGINPEKHKIQHLEVSIKYKTNENTLEIEIDLKYSPPFLKSQIEHHSLVLNKTREKNCTIQEKESLEYDSVEDEIYFSNINLNLIPGEYKFGDNVLFCIKPNSVPFAKFMFIVEDQDLLNFIIQKYGFENKKSVSYEKNKLLFYEYVMETVKDFFMKTTNSEKTFEHEVQIYDIFFDYVMEFISKKAKWIRLLEAKLSLLEHSYKSSYSNTNTNPDIRLMICYNKHTNSNKRYILRTIPWSGTHFKIRNITGKYNIVDKYGNYILLESYDERYL